MNAELDHTAGGWLHSSFTEAGRKAGRRVGRQTG